MPGLLKLTMKSPVRRLLFWHLPLGVGLLALALFLSGAIAATSGRVGTSLGGPESSASLESPNASRPSDGRIRIVALGDSLTRGAGDASGGGYPARVARVLRRGPGEGSSPREVVVDNLAVDGYQTPDLIRRLEEPLVREKVAAASLVLVSISGNDLTRALPVLAGVRGLQAASDKAAGPLETAGANARTILKTIRQLNPRAPIRLLGVYNPFTGSGPERQLGRQVLRLWNGALEEASLAVEDCLFVPLADAFELRPDRISPDRFHPGSNGYDEIAARVVSGLPEPFVASRPVGAATGPSAPPGPPS